MHEPSHHPSPAASGAKSAVTISIVRRPRPGQENEYARLLRELVAISRTFPGFVDGRVIRPLRGETEFRTLLWFRSQADVNAWKDWPARLAILEKADAIASEAVVSNVTGTAQATRLVMALTPLEQFVATSVSGIGLLLFGTVLAMVMANSPLAHAYEAFWHTRTTIGADTVGISMSLRHWVNDGLMALFFFVVGLEIKREVLVGEMRYPRQAALAIAAAVGGVTVPALTFLAFNAGQPGASGWGVPIGTDTAFALGIITLFGTRVRPMLLVFLTAFSIVDDILAVGVIAVFYTDAISPGAIGIALALMIALWIVNRAGFHRWPVYAILGVCVWVAVLKSGIHATAAGVLVALAVPARSWINPSEFLTRSRQAIEDFERACFIAPSILTNEPQQQATQQLGHLVEDVETPMTYFQSRLNPWVAFIILPIFAFANAGVTLAGGELGEALRNPVAWGVMAGLVLGKPVGIFLFSWLAVKSGIATMPGAITWRHISGVACLGGVGFTISLFITELAFAEGRLAGVARVGILAGSLIAGTLGYLVLRATLPPPREA